MTLDLVTRICVQDARHVDAAAAVPRESSRPRRDGSFPSERANRRSYHEALFRVDCGPSCIVRKSAAVSGNRSFAKTGSNREVAPTVPMGV